MNCEYRNCNNEFTERLNKRFCCRSCKGKESIYKGRDSKPKLKRGRKISTYKSIGSLTENDIEKLKCILN